MTTLFDALKSVKRYLEREPLSDLLAEQASRIRRTFETRQKAASVDRREAAALRRAAEALEQDVTELSAQAVRDPQTGFTLCSDRFQSEVRKMEEQSTAASEKLKHAFAFLEAAFGDSQEMVVFVTELNTNFFSTWFIGQYGSDAYTRRNKDLMIGKQRQELLSDIGSVQSFLTVL